MYKLNPRRVFVHRRVYDNPKAAARLERMLDGLGNPAFDVIDENGADEVIAAAGCREELTVQSSRVRQGIEKIDADPVFLFNTFVWEQDRMQPVTKKYANPRARSVAQAVAGMRPAYGRREQSNGLDDRPYVCQGGWSIHSINGCVHRCDYCGLGYAVNFMLDVEAFAEDLERVFREHPHQMLYRYDLSSDYPCFEPEYGASEVLGECFQRNGKYLLVYTKSNNVDHLLDLPYKEHMPCYWTVATDTQCSQIERGTPNLDERLEAMRKCQQAGYTVRAGFSPIIPHVGWREEATTALEKLFAAATPDTVRLWVVSMMTCPEAEQIFGADNLDPRMLEAMRAADADMRGKHSSPFPAEARAEIYRHYIEEIHRISPDTPVNLCTEERALWDMLDDVLYMDPENLFCCCGQFSVPQVTGG
ncbi:MAG: hypothetical protein HN742_10385 [Lentisphaerae bacterium]|jgi:DNA repair photolyase|nr:hypothetical protein [Lentisphaerota bacterium]MBT4816450.1 hypothetical protein [Lentisphaerota bacterium]MBT5611366.1 hypothetical protein [Lentisphaerota bacterium]MBT7061547.1 hypothetical protein [Lentisphaerota bacterium]MBT7842271.1 hypothetical protein [Lentisphaerota bacterium]